MPYEGVPAGLGVGRWAVETSGPTGAPRFVSTSSSVGTPSALGGEEPWLPAAWGSAHSRCPISAHDSVMVIDVSLCCLAMVEPELYSSGGNGGLSGKSGAGGFESGNVEGFSVSVFLCVPCVEAGGLYGLLCWVTGPRKI